LSPKKRQKRLTARRLGKSGNLERFCAPTNARNKKGTRSLRVPFLRFIVFVILNDVFRVSFFAACRRSVRQGAT
jgi:hypothetical protein